MKTSFTIAIFLILILVGMSVWLQFDEDLIPEIEHIITDVEGDQLLESEAFLYLTGISAAKNEDVIAVGKEIFSEIRLVEEAYTKSGSGETFKLERRPNRLEFPDSADPIYCSLHERDCFSTVLATKERWTRELEQRREIYQRYLTFIQYNEFTTLTKPAFNEIFPEYRYLVTGNRLRLLELVTKASSGDPEQAWSELMRDISLLRTQLRVGDNVLHKTIFAKLIANNIDALIHIKSNYYPEQTDNLSMLSEEELTYDRVIAREIYMTHTLFTSLDRRPDLFISEGNYPAWFVRMSYKPNKSMNQAYSGFAEMSRIIGLSADEFAHEAPQFDPATFAKFDITNAAGSLLSSVSVTDLSKYKAVLNDLNVKINLFNYLLSTVNAKLVNPYYPDSKVVVPAAGELCLDGPFPDDKISRCVLLNH